ncbi:hypothetical protein BBJ28_00011690 [Nothophytophthora sp. Chile5]|nr:hypothetical protein BBJ28_00011690 [Nothophytophthora sp. Chile5]
MQTEVPLHHLPRHEKKRLVKGWHAITHASSSISADEAEHEEMASLSGMRSLFAAPPGALAYEITSQRFGTSESSRTLHNQQAHAQQDDGKETLPMTVAQVKYAYRTRARKEEAHETATAIRKQTQHFQMLKGALRRGKELSTKTAPVQGLTTALPPKSTSGSDDKESVEAPNTSDEDQDGVLLLLDLPVHEVETNGAYRDDILRQIRRQLADGGQVLLQSDCGVAGDSISDTRLMMQTLCSQSLAFCPRDQNIVPETLVSHPSTCLALLLLPRRQSPPQNQ